jgi:leucyl/phenylalanyl-tRNA---protein transferase
MSSEVMAVGGGITAKSLIAAYRAGVFPMWVDVEGDTSDVLAWFSPDPRAVLRAPGMTPSRSLRRSMRGFTITFDTLFADVLAGCSDPMRPHGWITPDYEDAYRELFALGFAHSVEVMASGELAGGLIGIGIGGLFCADSKFRRVTNASKAAVAGLSALMFGDAYAHRRLIDAQWPTDHLHSIGFEAMPREEYLQVIEVAMKVPSPFPVR